MLQTHSRLSVVVFITFSLALVFILAFPHYTHASTTLSLTTSPSSVVNGSKSTLTWKSTNATACLAAGGWGNPVGLSGSRSVSPTKTTKYSLACTGAGGTVRKEVTVTVTPKNNPILPVDKNLGKWFSLTYPGHDGGMLYQYSAVDLHLPNDADNGTPVRAIQDGDVLVNPNSAIKNDYRVIQHNKDLTLENGTVIKAPWYSLYGHMASPIAEGTKNVKKGKEIGKISNYGIPTAAGGKGPGKQGGANHLHFSIFRKYSKSAAKTDAISPYWLPGDYRDRTLYADAACSKDSKCIRTPAGLYESRIFLPTLKK